MINHSLSDSSREPSHEFHFGSPSLLKNITKLGTILIPCSLSSPKKLKLGATTCIISAATILLGFVSIWYSLSSNPIKKPDYGEAWKKKAKKNNLSCSCEDNTVYTNFSVISIPGDGKCLFRSIAHGLCLAKGEPAPDANLQESLADKLRSEIVKMFEDRRQEVEERFLIEGDFDEHIFEMRQPRKWGGFPELCMAVHVIERPIKVFMPMDGGSGVRPISEHGQEDYGNHNPVSLLYHSGHYDLLLIPKD